MANREVDAYIAKCAAFARPILTHLRELVHRACPEATEAMKWSRPFFLYRDVILCNISGFKEHCSFGFWGAEMAELLQADGVVQEGGMGSLGRITSLDDLPADDRMLAYVRRAAEKIDAGQGQNRVTLARKVVKAPKAELDTPAELSAALARNKAAAKTFEAFSPSCRREYVQWIADAKRAETRERRVAQAVEWMAEGKQRNWKYQDC